MATLLLYAPHAPRREALIELLSRWPGLALVIAKTAHDYNKALADRPDAVLADLDEPLAELPTGQCLQLLPTAEGAGSLARPIRWQQIASRLQLMIGRSDEEMEFAVGPYTCVPTERLVLDAQGNDLVRLTDKEVQLLRLLASSAEPVGRSELLEKVWGYRDDLDTHTLETHIYRLRQKLERDPADPQILLTSEGGYRLAESDTGPLS